MEHGRDRRVSAFSALIVLACLSAHLALVGAGFWHHHDDGEAAHDACPVCIAAASEQSDGLDPSPVVPSASALIGMAGAPTLPDTSIAVPSDGRARGPPRRSAQIIAVTTA